MTILPQAQINKQWILAVLFGSIIYTVISGAEIAGNVFSKLTFLEKVHAYLGCLITTLLYSFLASSVALYLNKLIYYLISCNASIKNQANWLVFLLFPPFVSTVIYCGIFPFIAHKDTSYLQQFMQVAKFLLPWILSAVTVTVVLNRHLPSIEKRWS
jgi:hypothetical protein